MRYRHTHKSKRFPKKRFAAALLAVILIGSILATVVNPGHAKADIAFVNGTTGVDASGTTVTANKPTGLATGNLLLAELTFDSSRTTTTVTAPSGWTHLGSQITTNSRYQNIYYKVATGSEPSSYTWTLSRTSNIAVGIGAFSGVSTTSPIDASATQTDTSSTTPGAPAAVANANGDMLVSAWGYGRSITASSYSSGLAQSWSTSTTNVGISAAYKLLTNAGSSGTTSSTITTSSTATANTVLLKGAAAAAGISFVAADTPATCTGCTTLNPAAPTGWKAGDFFITSVQWTIATANLTAPSGWTQIDTTQNDGNYSTADFYHFAITGDPSSYSWNFDNTTRAVVATVDFKGVDTDQPIDVSLPQIDASNSTSHNSPSVTTAFSNDMLFDIWSYERGVLMSTHTSTTTQAWSARSGSSTSDVGTWSGYESLGNAGSTGTRNTTVGSTTHAIMHTIALKPFLPTPSLIAPGDGDTGTAFSGTQFQLKNISLGSTPLEYKIRLCGDSACNTILATYDETSSQVGWSGQDANSGTAYVGGTTLDDSTTATYTVQTPLSSGTQYWWRAFSFDTGSSTLSLPSNIATFTTNFVPSAPTLFTPANGAPGISVNPEFQLASTDGDQDNLQYKIQLCADSSCSSVLQTIDQSTNQTSWSGQDSDGDTTYGSDNVSAAVSTTAYYNFNTSQLTVNTQYWWRAYAIDPAGSDTWSSASAIHAFTVNAAETKILNGTIMNGKIL